jgi:S1-C subfamily serine protease
MNTLTYFKLFIAVILSCCSFLVSAEEISISGIENSVIKIYATLVEPDYVAPWKLKNPQQVSGSGVIISEHRILTNAHVVANAKYIQLQKYKDPIKYIAEVSFISHEADLAILKVRDSNFFAHTKPLPIGELPKPYQEVAVFGYPMGGESLSITKGILSRVEHQFYAHASSFLLAGQIDAAINSGNSGGPVIADQKIVGIVMQNMDKRQAENIGYFIPPSVIEHVLKDSEDGINDGFPTLDFTIQPLENPSAKSYYGLDAGQNGVLVTQVFADSTANQVLKKNDVILKIDDYQISDDGSVNYTSTLRSHLKHAIDLHYVGDKVQITYVRGSKVNTTFLTAQKHPKHHGLIAPIEFDMPPRYYIYGGILFVPLTNNLLYMMDRNPLDVWQSPSELYETKEKHEMVIALQVLTADVNFGYDSMRGWMVDFINGTPVRDFAQFAQLLEQNKNKYVVFEDKNGQQVVINHTQALQSESAIFKNYGVNKRYSDGLFK